MPTEILTHTPTKPHFDAKRPYGYNFNNIDLIKLTDFDEALTLLCELSNEHHQHNIQLGPNSPHTDRIIWEVASYIEGNFGPPYNAILVYSEEHSGGLFIYTPKNKWWNQETWAHLSNYLMGLRSLLDLVTPESST